MSQEKKRSLRECAWKLALPAILLLGFLVRLRMSILAFFVEFDTATVGLMGLHILKGVSRPLFFYGQSYMGALEAYLASLMFLIFGVSDVSLSLSPILFALMWIAASYFLFRELFGRTGAIAAALCVAVPGWYAQWFSLAAHGGYPGTFFFGTFFLWLALRMLLHDLSPRSKWLHAAGMGVSAALGIWTNLQVLSYLASGALILLLTLCRKGINKTTMTALAFAGAVSLLGLIPVLLVTGDVAFDSMTTDTPSLKLIPGNLKVLCETMPALFTWPVTREFTMVNLFVLGCLGVLTVPFLCHVCTSLRPGRNRTVWVPLLFAGVFLVMYLPHPMAGLGAPRYLIPLTIVLVCTTFASAVTAKNRMLRRFAWLALVAWVSFNAISGEMTSRAKAPKKKARCAEYFEVVDLVETAGLKNVTIIGSDIGGLSGQILSFFARDRLRFVSSYYERYDPSAQIAEQDPNMAFMCSRRHFSKVKANFTAAGITDYKVIDSGEMILHSIEVPRINESSVPLADLGITTSGPVTGKPSFAIDHSANTALAFARSQTGPVTCSIIIDAQRPVTLGCAFLTSTKSDLLPGTWHLSTSTNGTDYIRRGGIDRALHAYVDGNKAYIMGHYARGEIRFEPVTAQYVKIDIVSQRPWEINELRLFKQLGNGSPVSEEEVEDITEAIIDKGVDFTVTDRWLSSSLITKLPSRDNRLPVYPRFNPRYSYTRIERTFRPRDGLGVAVVSRLADEMETFLGTVLKEKAEFARTDFPHYSLFTFSAPAPGAQDLPRFSWNGHLLLLP
ncbi:MAG: glycosyltransferase family 39 protein [Kiritimatiellia bacterium]|jgi:hypothetical protein|nr:glycosyltransferase family 39 protein [Kiritimatiellia bacterium]